MELASEIFEIIMIVAFGFSWPFNLIKAYKARTTKGTSLLFTALIFFGYVAGIVSKIFASLCASNYWTFIHVLQFAFYCINFAMLSMALIIYFRNKRLDKEVK